MWVQYNKVNISIYKSIKIIKNVYYDFYCSVLLLKRSLNNLLDNGGLLRWDWNGSLL